MIDQSDRSILREVAQRVVDIAAMPVMGQRRELWKRHNSLRPVRPMILVFPEGSWEELLPGSSVRCQGEQARKHEWGLRARIYHHEHFQDDTVIEKEWVVSKVTRHSDWGLNAQHINSPERRGAWHFDPIIKEPADLKKLRFPDITYDEKATERNLAEAQDLFGDILDVKLRGIAHLSYHLMNHYTGLRGLEEVMLDMYDNQAMLHDAMAFLEEGHKRILRQYVEMNLLSLNNDGTYHNSGGVGYTDELPKPGFDPKQVRPCDMWASAESQEMTQVSPEMHAEFVLPYESRLLEPFALTGYGCCDDLSYKLEDVCAMPHMRRISISPFANVDVCARKLQGNYIFSWKPQPSHLVGEFNEPLIRDYIRHTLDAAKQNHCVLEMILKDTHTCQNHPERFDRWTQIARELVGA